MQSRRIFRLPFCFVLLGAAIPSLAQTPAQSTSQSPPGATGGNTPVPAAGAAGNRQTTQRPARRNAYPEHPPADPAVIARGKALYGVNCSFCHGSDARGGEGGPNLIRSELVLNDRDGELIATVVQNGRPDRGMPKFNLDASAISSIAAYIHSFKVGGYDVSRQQPISILVGDANAGKAYFDAHCVKCHSVTGDLKGIASRIEDPKMLQQAFLMPGGSGRGFQQQAAVHVPPTTVTVTLPSGERIEGALTRIDDFIVSLTMPDGTVRTFRRDGDVPNVEIHDPIQPHRNLLPEYTDKDIHDLTAYLVTLK